jgi:hypothetical protein
LAGDPQIFEQQQSLLRCMIPEAEGALSKVPATPTAFAKPEGPSDESWLLNTLNTEQEAKGCEAEPSVTA